MGLRGLRGWGCGGRMVFSSSSMIKKMRFKQDLNAPERSSEFVIYFGLKQGLFQIDRQFV